MRHHTRVTPPYLPAHICNLATSQHLAVRKHKLTSFTASHVIVNEKLRRNPKLQHQNYLFDSFFRVGLGLAEVQVHNCLSVNTYCKTPSEPAGNELTQSSAICMSNHSLWQKEIWPNVMHNVGVWPPEYLLVQFIISSSFTLPVWEMMKRCTERKLCSVYKVEKICMISPATFILTLM